MMITVINAREEQARRAVEAALVRPSIGPSSSERSVPRRELPWALQVALATLTPIVL